MKHLKLLIAVLSLACLTLIAQTVPNSFKTVAPKTAIGSVTPCTFSWVTNAIVGPRIRVSVPAPASEGWFIQMNPVDPAKEGEWFTAPSSSRLPDGTAYYDASPKLTGWWRAIRKG